MRSAQGFCCDLCLRRKKRRSIKLHTITNTTPQITHKAPAGRVRWAFDVWHALQAIRRQPTRDLFCCSCLLSVARCDTKCAYSAHQPPTDGQPDRTTARFTASRAVAMFGQPACRQGSPFKKKMQAAQGIYSGR
jgi:hypothetical protein